MVTENIQNIRENVKRVCSEIDRSPNDITLIAVSKTFPTEKIIEACASGTADFGENYVQELLDKRNTLIEKNIRWHFIGHLQSNKVRYIADWVHLIHSIDSENLGLEIQKRAEKSNRVINVLVEVNTSDEATKFGVRPAQAINLLKKISKYPNINLKGLMTIGPFTDNKNESQKSFRLLKSIFDEVNAMAFLQQPMVELSMGMTHDYEIALAEGATMIRIGTAIFGSRTVTSH